MKNEHQGHRFTKIPNSGTKLHVQINRLHMLLVGVIYEDCNVLQSFQITFTKLPVVHVVGNRCKYKAESYLFILKKKKIPDGTFFCIDNSFSTRGKVRLFSLK